MKWNPRLIFDRIISGKSLQQLELVFILFITILLFIAGIYTLFGRHGRFDENIHQVFVDMTNPETVRDSAYYASQPFFKENAQNEITNQPSKNKPGFWVVFGLVVVYVLGAVFFTGLLIATITNIWRGRADKFRRGAVKYKFSNHIIFLGYNSLIPGMIQKICEEEHNRIKDIRIVVGVENDASLVNKKIKNRLYDRYRDKVVVLQADSCNMKDLKRLRVSYAKEVYIIGEYDDAYNLRSYRTIYELSLNEKSAKASMPECYVNLQSQATLTLFRTYASAGDLGINFSKFHSFSFYDEWAKSMINKHWKNNEDFQDHFIIAGMTEMGIALARKAALLCHKPNDSKHTIITLIDDGVSTKAEHFIIQHQELFDHIIYRIRTKTKNYDHIPIKYNDLLDVTFEFIEGSFSDKSIRQEITDNANNDQKKITLAICYDNPQQNIISGLNLPNIFYEEKHKISIWLYQPTLGDLGYYLNNSRYKNVITFGMTGKDLDIQNTENTRRAKLINHYFRHQKDENKNDADSNKILNDYSNQRLIDTEWEDTNISERWACIRRAEFIPFLAHYMDNDKNMEKMECQRNAVDNLLFPIFEDGNTYSIQNDYSLYIATIKRFYTTNNFTFLNKIK